MEGAPGLPAAMPDRVMGADGKYYLTDTGKAKKRRKMRDHVKGSLRSELLGSMDKVNKLPKLPEQMKGKTSALAIKDVMKSKK